jgi:hypothetical protein
MTTFGIAFYESYLSTSGNIQRDLNGAEKPKNEFQCDQYLEKCIIFKLLIFRWNNIFSCFRTISYLVNAASAFRYKCNARICESQSVSSSVRYSLDFVFVLLEALAAKIFVISYISIVSK